MLLWGAHLLVIRPMYRGTLTRTAPPALLATRTTSPASQGVATGNEPAMYWGTISQGWFWAVAMLVSR